MAFLVAGLAWFTSDVWCPKAPRLCLPDPGAAPGATAAATAATPLPAGGDLGPRLTPGTGAGSSSAAGAMPQAPTQPAIDLAPTVTYSLFPTAPAFNPGGMNPFATLGPGGLNPFATPSFPIDGGAADPLINPDSAFATPTWTPRAPDGLSDEPVTPSGFVTVTPASYPGGDSAAARPTRTPTPTATRSGSSAQGGYPGP